MNNSKHADFTLKAYDALLERAASRFHFVSFDDISLDGRVAIWRHDIDFSPHRALAMAELENERGIRATYFVQLTSPFYSTFEPDVLARLKKIRDLGHAIGLHFDASADSSVRRLQFEADVLSTQVGTIIKVFSLHNPTTYDSRQFEATHVAGLINASASEILERFTYCSDSNGYWRFKSLGDLVDHPKTQNVYALTHPEWWQEQPMTPRERIKRCIEGRAVNCINYYDGLLSLNSRVNVGRQDCE